MAPLTFDEENFQEKTLEELEKGLEELQGDSTEMFQWEKKRKIYEIWENLLRSLEEKNYPRSYSLLKILKKNAEPRPLYEAEMLHTEILSESLNCTLRMFKTICETMNLYYALSDLNLHQSCSISPHGKFRKESLLLKSDDGLLDISLRGTILELACSFGSREQVAFLLKFPFSQKEFSAIHFGNNLAFWNPSLLTYAVVTGNIAVTKLLLNNPDHIDPEDSALQAIALFQLYWSDSWKNLGNSGHLLFMKQAAELVFDKVYHFPTIFSYCPKHTPWTPGFFRSLPMELSDWVVPQGWVAPLEALRDWFSTGRYGRKEALEIIHSYKTNVLEQREFLCLYNRAVYRRIFGLSGIFLRYVPEIGKDPDFVRFLFKSDFELEIASSTDPFTLFDYIGEKEILSETVLTEQVMEDLRVGMAQMNQPMKLSTKDFVFDFLIDGNDIKQRILQLLHHTCGAELCGEALKTLLPSGNKPTGSSFSLLLECCTRDKTPLKHYSFIAQQIAHNGSISQLKIALKNGLLEGEPWSEFIQILKDNKQYGLIAIALINAPKQDNRYSL